MGKINTLFRLLREDRAGLRKAFADNFSNSRLSRIIPDEAFLRFKYKACIGKPLNLENPKTFNEKLNWLKLYDRNPKYCRLVDKYEVKKYIAEVLGEAYVVPTLGVWESVDDIDFDALPDKFVLKGTHDSGSVVLCADKSTFDIEKAKAKLRKAMKSNLFWMAREWPYKNVKPRIIAEKYMEDCATGDMIDYKFFTFNGEPKALYISQGLSDHTTARVSFFDMNGQRMPFKRTDFAELEGQLEMPSRFAQMIDISKKLAKDIDTPFVRIDLYQSGEQIYFSEITFYPCAGFLPFEPEQWDAKLGEYIVLPKEENTK